MFSFVIIHWNIQFLPTIRSVIVFLKREVSLNARMRFLALKKQSRHWNCLLVLTPQPDSVIRSQAWGSGGVLYLKRKSPLRPTSPPSSPSPVQTSTLSVLSDPRQRRSWTLFLTCPSAPGGIPLMSHYGEQMQPGQPGGKQPAKLT